MPHADPSALCPHKQIQAEVTHREHHFDDYDSVVAQSNITHPTHVLADWPSHTTSAASSPCIISSTHTFLPAVTGVLRNFILEKRLLAPTVCNPPALSWQGIL